MLERKKNPSAPLLNQGESPQPPDSVLAESPESATTPARTGASTRKPWLTYAACAISLGVFLGLSLEGPSPDWEAFSKWGALPPDEIWGGGYWALLTSVFVHGDLWHVAFNVYWLWVLGRPLERTIGSIRWLLFFLAAAITSSGMQLAASGTTGIGMSGVVYAVFGFLWVAGRGDPGLRPLVSREQVLIFLAWLVGCILVDAAGIWDVGNTAHVSGLAFGATLGAAKISGPRKRLPAWTGALALFLASLFPLWWCPWSFGWVSYKGYEAHGRGDYETAERYYRRSLEMAGDPVWSLKNLALIYYTTGKREKLTATMTQLRQLDRKAAESVEQQILRKP